MPSTVEILDQLEALGFSFFSGVPCSYLAPLINALENSETLDFYTAANEAEACAVAAGSWLNSNKAVVMCQNSGLGNMVNPITSLNHPFQIPFLLVVSWRGEPGRKDEPQHEVMGSIMAKQLDLLDIKYEVVSNDTESICEILKNANDWMEHSQKPFALVLREGTFEPVKLLPKGARQRKHQTHHYENKFSANKPTRFATLQAILKAIPSDLPIIATTGKTGRELCTIADQDRFLYQVGSMGLASSMAHGLALTSDKQTIVLDGDGAALMHMGAMASIGSNQAPLLHIILDNGCHDSTGGQKISAYGVDYGLLAQSFGYRSFCSCNKLDEIGDVLDNFVGKDGPHLLHISIAAGSQKNLPRPNVKPHAVARRFRNWHEKNK